MIGPEREYPMLKMLLQVHDELIFEVPDNAALIAQLKVEIAMHMSQAANLSIPLTVDVNSGYNWDEAH